MPKHDTSKTPPRARRLRGDVPLKRLGVRLTPAGESARAHLVEHLARHPRKEHPANDSGAVNLALEEAAKARGWTPPEEDK
ncbi:hypothetical protein [Myxococcus virescens]|uniref:Uncharacterized protein n=1 Tax=Myxococcus virescens TaxID=83456 RepID=A0A511HPK5_9BACT|nr:hypothetical protein [Myxococcus virescens]GEL75520.1 hypothetical protein MVI01_73040 [Myxococcus virescens]SDD65650.1 hypothetical protein SAMN04488504_102150 [Myxococcus virescens]